MGGAPAADGSRLRRSLLRGVMADRNFQRLWLSGLAFSFGDQFALLALSVTSVLVLHASTFQVGALGALGLSGYLVLGIPVGVWVDRWRKKPVLVGAEVVRAVSVLVIPVAYLTDELSMGMVFAAAASIGVAGVFFETAHTSVLPALIGRDAVSEGSARLQTIETTMRLVGPGLAGQVLRFTAGPVLYFVSAVAGAVSALLIIGMRIDETKVAKTEREPFLSSLRQGAGFVLRHPVLRTFMSTSATINFGAGMFLAVLPLVVLRDLGIPPQTYGLIVSVGGVGGLVGSLLGLRIKNGLGEIRALQVMQCLFPFGLAGPAIATMLPAAASLLIGLAEALFGFTIVVHNISASGIRAKITPHRLMGRVSAASRFVSLGALPVGSLLGGALGSWWSHATVMLVAGAIAAVAPLILTLSPVGRFRTIPLMWLADAASETV